jgi:CheY-like chemotaxis protein
MQDTTAQLKIAIVEDSKMLREMLSEMMNGIDRVDVEILADGQTSALQQIAECPVDVAIVDLELKEGSGLGLIRALNHDPQKYGAPKSVVFSNYAVSSISRRCRDLGVDEIFDKSFQLPELIRFIKNQVGAS